MRRIHLLVDHLVFGDDGGTAIATDGGPSLRQILGVAEIAQVDRGSNIDHFDVQLKILDVQVEKLFHGEILSWCSNFHAPHCERTRSKLTRLPATANCVPEGVSQ